MFQLRSRRAPNIVLPLLLALLPSLSWAALTTTHLPLQSTSVLVVDRATGKTLYQHNPDNVMPVASITKLMAAVIVMETKMPLGIRTKVTSDDVDRIKWSHSRLPVGVSLRRSTLLRIALMSSENRAAFALSRQLPGGRKEFVDRMNAKAYSLGMLHTHFDDPTGLSPANVSTARDLRRLMSVVNKYPRLRAYTTATQASVHKHSILYSNSNALVRAHAWPIKLQKTGYINEAGHCLVMISSIKGHDVDIVILGGPNSHAHYDDARTIKRWLEHQFS